MDSRRFGAPCRGGEPSGPPRGGTVAAPPVIGRSKGVLETREAGRPLHYTHTATRSASLERNTNKKTTDGPNLCIPHRRRAKRLIAEPKEGGQGLLCSLHGVLSAVGAVSTRQVVRKWCGRGVPCPRGATHDIPVLCLRGIERASRQRCLSGMSGKHMGSCVRLGCVIVLLRLGARREATN